MFVPHLDKVIEINLLYVLRRTPNFDFRLAGKSSGRNDQASISIFGQEAYQFSYFANGDFLISMFNLYLEPWGTAAQRITISKDINAAILPSGCYKRRVIAHAAQ